MHVLNKPITNDVFLKREILRSRKNTSKKPRRGKIFLCDEGNQTPIGVLKRKSMLVVNRLLGFQEILRLKVVAENNLLSLHVFGDTDIKISRLKYILASCHHKIWIKSSITAWLTKREMGSFSK